MTEAPETSETPMSQTTIPVGDGTVPESTSETPSGYLRWVPRPKRHPRDVAFPVLQQMFYRTTYRGTDVEQVEVWRDVPVATEE